jgi:hypothetical protein
MKDQVVFIYYENDKNRPTLICVKLKWSYILVCMFGEKNNLQKAYLVTLAVHNTLTFIVIISCY